MGVLQEDGDDVGRGKVAMRDEYAQEKEPMFTFILGLVEVPVVGAGIAVGALVAHELAPALARIIAG